MVDVVEYLKSAKDKYRVGARDGPKERAETEGIL